MCKDDSVKQFVAAREHLVTTLLEMEPLRSLYHLADRICEALARLAK